MCWSALAGGLVTGKYNRGPLAANELYRLREHVDPQQTAFWSAVTQRNLAIMEGVVKLADEWGLPPVQLALRWLMQQKVTTIPIFSARTLDQAKEILDCCNLTLSETQMQQIDQVTQPAIASIMPAVGPYPYPMLEYGSPALPHFYSRTLLFGELPLIWRT